MENSGTSLPLQTALTPSRGGSRQLQQTASTHNHAKSNAEQPVLFESALLDSFDTLPDFEIICDLAELFKIFGDTTRLKILFTLMGHDLCVQDIAKQTKTTQSAVSHQLRILKQQHLVGYHRVGRTIVYSLTNRHVNAILSQGLTHICE